MMLHNLPTRAVTDHTWSGRHLDWRTDPGQYGAIHFHDDDMGDCGWPESFAVELIDTPFTAPRRLRFDSEGALWIPGFSSSVLARFDPKTRAFEQFPLPIEPKGSETPYALNVDRQSGEVWICGTNSDSLLRFVPASKAFTIYPLPTRVTYTREIDFDAEGRVWTSNSNLPTWQVEGGFPRVLRLDPGAAGRVAARAR